MPKGFGYFGHGHYPVDHDALSCAGTADSFRRCFDTMRNWGLKPVACAYPGNAGTKKKTQKALERSGFLCGKLRARSDRLCSILGLLAGRLPAGIRGTANADGRGMAGRLDCGHPCPENGAPKASQEGS